MKRPEKASAPRNEGEAGQAGFALFCLFVISFLIHLPARIPLLGVIRIDVLLASAALVSLLLSGQLQAVSQRPDPTYKAIAVLLSYILITLPFVQWPGSVLKGGLEPFLKSLCFFLFIVATITTESRLRTFMAIFVSCQVFRVLEPLYLHITEGYWGSHTDMGDEDMFRLSGAPYDVVGPNGLAQVILITIPLLYGLLLPGKLPGKLLFLTLAATMTQVLLLTGSRSGFIVLVLLIAYIITLSRYRTVALVTVTLGAIIAFGSMSDLQRQRYLSIVSHDAKGGATAKGRIDGVIADFNVALSRPLFGHGLGTSMEANVHERGIMQLSHNLYTEVAQELGFVGLAIFVTFLVASIRNCRRAIAATGGMQSPGYLGRVGQGLLILMSVNILFSMASYGLSTYEWYLMAGLSVVILRLSTIESAVVPTGHVRKGRSLVPVINSRR